MDITGGNVGDWLVIGWFTPDYRPLAEKFAANLAEHGAPFHLFARPKPASGWSTHQKPAVVLDAMGAYPDKTLVLMDVDCVIGGDVAPAIDVARATDVGINILLRQVGETRKIGIAASSRVAVFRPTAGAREFAENWRVLCDPVNPTEYPDDEMAMVQAFVKLPHIAYAYLDPRYTGRAPSELGSNDNAVITHESAHAKELLAHLSGWAALKAKFKSLEQRFLRSGRARQRKRQALRTTTRV